MSNVTNLAFRLSPIIARERSEMGIGWVDIKVEEVNENWLEGMTPES